MFLLPVSIILMAAVLVKIVTNTGFAGINRLAGMLDCNLQQSLLFHFHAVPNSFLYFVMGSWNGACFFFFV